MPQPSLNQRDRKGTFYLFFSKQADFSTGKRRLPQNLALDSRFRLRYDKHVKMEQYCETPCDFKRMEGILCPQFMN